MIFALRMALREVRAAWKQLSLFFLCIAIGVGSIVAIRSFTASFDAYFAHEARALNGGDVVVQTDRDPTGVVTAAVDRAASSPGVLELSNVTTTTTMLRPVRGATAKVVELDGVDAAYPLYGY